MFAIEFPRISDNPMAFFDAVCLCRCSLLFFLPEMGAYNPQLLFTLICHQLHVYHAPHVQLLGQ